MRLTYIPLAALCSLGSMFVNPAHGASDTGMYCTATAKTIDRACRLEASDDFQKTSAICVNYAESDDRAECYEEAGTARADALESCTEQLAARQSVCADVGEARYDPEFDEIPFVSDYRNPSTINPYYPLRIGNKWELRGGGEIVKIEVLDKTKLIDEVRCVVVRDIVTDDGVLKEATDDRIAVARDGNIWYCGEEVKDYETFAGDRPRAPELVSRDGSFKAGQEGDKPGILFLASPRVGKVYREEFSLANAEDVSKVLSKTYSYGEVPALDRFVPRTLAQLLCSRNCVVLKAYTALEPGVVEYKYYAPGIGLFLEVKPASGDTVQLVSCNLDPRCASLPRP